jgi:hypothetical protein
MKTFIRFMKDFIQILLVVMFAILAVSVLMFGFTGHIMLVLRSILGMVLVEALLFLGCMDWNIKELWNEVLKRKRIEDRSYDGRLVQIEYKLTWKEWFCVLFAFFMSSFFGGCQADYMGSDLEELMCGDVPCRHKILPIPEEKK